LHFAQYIIKCARQNSVIRIIRCIGQLSKTKLEDTKAQSTPYLIYISENNLQTKLRNTTNTIGKIDSFLGCRIFNYGKDKYITAEFGKKKSYKFREYGVLPYVASEALRGQNIYSISTEYKTRIDREAQCSSQ
jgi:hypothetical protein